MGIVRIFKKRKPTFWPAGLSVTVPPPIEMDASVREDHVTSFAITQFPVEGGALATDHVVELPEAITLDVVAGVYTDTVIPNLIATRHLRIYDQLKQLARTKLPFDLVTTANIYTSMLFQAIRLPRTVKETHTLIITCQLRKFEIALVDAAATMAAAAQEIALAQEDLGATAGTAITAIPLA